MFKHRTVQLVAVAKNAFRECWKLLANECCLRAENFFWRFRVHFRPPPLQESEGRPKIAHTSGVSISNSNFEVIFKSRLFSFSFIAFARIHSNFRRRLYFRSRGRQTAFAYSFPARSPQHSRSTGATDVHGSRIHVLFSRRHKRPSAIT